MDTEYVVFKIQYSCNAIIITFEKKTHIFDCRAAVEKNDCER